MLLCITVMKSRLHPEVSPATSPNPNYLMKAPHSNMISLDIEALIYEFEGVQTFSH